MLLALLPAAVACAAATATAQVAGPGALLPSAQQAGQQRLRFWGLDVYDARLWVVPGFRQSEFARHGFALELSYLRPFSANDIATRSLAEMERAGGVGQEDAKRWHMALATVLPDVKSGDRLMGIHRPGRGALFLLNGQAVGEIADARFAELFFGIWLAASTSEPRLRQALLAGTPP